MSKKQKKEQDKVSKIRLSIYQKSVKKTEPTLASSSLPNAFKRFPKSLLTQYKSCHIENKTH